MKKSKERAYVFRLLLNLLSGVILLCSITVRPAIADSDWRCNVDLIFDTQNNETVANFVLTLQVKNILGRDISGVSVIYKDINMAVVGNTHLDCNVSIGPVKPGSYGECSRVLQSVDEDYTKTLSKEEWRDIVDYQLAKLRSVNYCHVLGFSY
jgi:hypothetical protein